MMLSPLLPLKLADMPWNPDVRLAAGDFWSDELDGNGAESFRDKGIDSVGVVWFRFRSAIFEDGGTGRTGTGRMRFGEFFTWLLCPSVRFSIEFPPVTGNIAGKTDTGNPLFFWCRGWSGECDTVFWCSWWSSIDESLNCWFDMIKIQFKKYTKQTTKSDIYLRCRNEGFNLY